jgi:hypothetical protein
MLSRAIGQESLWLRKHTLTAPKIRSQRRLGMPVPEPLALEAAKKDYHERYEGVPAARLVKRLLCGW